MLVLKILQLKIPIGNLYGINFIEGYFMETNEPRILNNFASLFKIKFQLNFSQFFIVLKQIANFFFIKQLSESAYI